MLCISTSTEVNAKPKGLLLVYVCEFVCQSPSNLNLMQNLHRELLCHWKSIVFHWDNSHLILQSSSKSEHTMIFFFSSPFATVNEMQQNPIHLLVLYRGLFAALIRSKSCIFRWADICIQVVCMCSDFLRNPFFYTGFRRDSSVIGWLL